MGNYHAVILTVKVCVCVPHVRVPVYPNPIFRVFSNRTKRQLDEKSGVSHNMGLRAVSARFLSSCMLFLSK